ncbi:MAG TPA: RNA methyltransferase substrate-binding domain-containing protein, partial [Steroidobacteraceae bacterium]|nr:RNA methyltransferase substrate-binding domain-containing protein [Steroidobacteraceae bacterium]
MKIEDIRRLHQKKHREESGHFLLEGEHLVLELQEAAVKNPRLRTSEIYLTRDFGHWRSQLAVHEVTSRQMEQISETRTPQGIVAVAPLLPAPPPL